MIYKALQRNQQQATGRNTEANLFSCSARTNGIMSHLKDKAIMTRCNDKGHKCKDRDLNLHSDD